MLWPGPRGAVTSRAEAQALRLGAIYAALDFSSVVGLPHLQAAYRGFRALLFGNTVQMIDALLDDFLHLTVQRRHNRDYPSPVSRIQ